MISLDNELLKIGSNNTVNNYQSESKEETKASKGVINSADADGVKISISDRGKKLSASYDVQNMRQKIFRLSSREDSIGNEDYNAKYAIESEISRLRAEINRVSNQNTKEELVADKGDFYEPGLIGNNSKIAFDQERVSEMMSKAVNSMLSNAGEAMKAQATFSSDEINALLI